MPKGRKRMPRRRDSQVFSHTAVKGKKINVNPHMSRGGIRL